MEGARSSSMPYGCRGAYPAGVRQVVQGVVQGTDSRPRRSLISCDDEHRGMQKLREAEERRYWW